MTNKEIREAIFGEIEKLKEEQIKLHKIFKGEETKENEKNEINNE